MMNTTGTTVVHVLFGPTRQTLRRSMAFDGSNTDSCEGVSKVLTSPPERAFSMYLFPPMPPDDRREFQRLKLTKPILGIMDGENTLILDIGMSGAFLEHYGAAEPGKRFRLSFRWQAADVVFVCEVVRTAVVRQPAGDGKSVVSHTGVHFVEAIGDSAALLHDLMSDFVGRIVAAQRSNAAGNPDTAGATVLSTLGAARRKRTKGYVSYRLKGANWWRVPTESTRQPEDGFTVPAWEDEAELDTLCRAYEESDEEGRKLIRLVADIAVTTP